MWLYVSAAECEINCLHTICVDCRATINIYMLFPLISFADLVISVNVALPRSFGLRSPQHTSPNRAAHEHNRPEHPTIRSHRFAGKITQRTHNIRTHTHTFGTVTTPVLRRFALSQLISIERRRSAPSRTVHIRTSHLHPLLRRSPQTPSAQQHVVIVSRLPPPSARPNFRTLIGDRAKNENNTSHQHTYTADAQSDDQSTKQFATATINLNTHLS